MPQANLSDDEVVTLGLNQEKYYGMSGTAARIWELLENEITLDELCSRLTKEFDVPKDVCLHQTREFIDSLLQENLVKITRQR